MSRYNRYMNEVICPGHGEPKMRRKDFLESYSHSEQIKTIAEIDYGVDGWLHSEAFRNGEIVNGGGKDDCNIRKSPEGSFNTVMVWKPVQYKVEQFVKNSYWRKVYIEAPTENSRRWRELEFAYSWDSYYDLGKKGWMEWFAEQDRLEKKFVLEDWEYLYKYCDDPQVKEKYKKKIDELNGAGSAAC